MHIIKSQFKRKFDENTQETVKMNESWNKNIRLSLLIAKIALWRKKNNVPNDIWGIVEDGGLLTKKEDCPPEARTSVCLVAQHIYIIHLCCFSMWQYFHSFKHHVVWLRREHKHYSRETTHTYTVGRRVEEVLSTAWVTNTVRFESRPCWRLYWAWEKRVECGVEEKHS